MQAARGAPLTGAAAQLIVLAGRPGVGKTTVSRLVAARAGAALVRLDAIETALVRAGLASFPVGPEGYALAQEIAATTLAVGTPVVVDAVNAVPEARAGWSALARRCAARLLMIELVLPDDVEHRRRVEGRTADLAGHVVPTWDQVERGTWVPWDEARDGPRLVVDATSAEAAAAAVGDRVASLG